MKKTIPKKIVWGASKLLEMYLYKTKINPFAYCIDNFFKGSKNYGMPIKKSKSLFQEEKGTFQVIIFAASSKSLQEISHDLSKMGLHYGEDFIFYSDFFYSGFLKKAETA